MTLLWIATANAKKRGELERLLAPIGYEVRAMTELAEPPTIVEDAPDFAGNAALKAVTLATAVGGFAVGDDSGLCVDALGGRPGVHSARYAGADASDADRIDKLLGELAGRADRAARFVCHVCLAGPDGNVLGRFEEQCEGVILEQQHGTGGFGYDPIFVAHEHTDRKPMPSFAELDPADKDAVSHRGRALRRLAAWLQEHPLEPTP